MTPTRSARFVVAVLVSVLAAGLQWWISTHTKVTTDFDPIRTGAGLLIHGGDPYTIGPNRSHYWLFPLLYPLPAVVLAVPFVALSQLWARVAFVALSSGILAFTVTRRTWWPLIGCASASFLYAVVDAQWSPLLLASWYIPALGCVIAAKPNIGLAILSAARSRQSALVVCAGAAMLTVVAFVLRPTWPLGWLAGVAEQHHFRPMVFSWLGAPMLLAALRWRRPEARLLLAMALLPANPSLYDSLLAFAVPASGRGILLLATLSWLVEPIRDALHPTNDPASMAHATATGLLALIYLPALVMVLRRPNHGELSRVPNGKSWPAVGPPAANESPGGSTAFGRLTR